MYRWYANLEKRLDNEVYADLSKSDKRIYTKYIDAKHAVDSDVDPSSRHVVMMVTETNERINQWMQQLDTYEAFIEYVRSKNLGQLSIDAESLLKHYNRL